jgi:hypothetical protein
MREVQSSKFKAQKKLQRGSSKRRLPLFEYLDLKFVLSFELWALSLGCSLRRWAFAAVFVLAVSCGLPRAFACSIPVFRYALDRWSADAYRLEVSAADAKDEAVAKFLRNLGASAPYNIEGVRLPAEAPGPSRLLFPPGKDGQRQEAWSGNLNAEVLGQFIKSPVRQQLVEQMVGGASGVWVFVESGDKEADDAAVARLEKRLRYLENVAQLPHIDPTDPTSKLGPGPKLQVKFNVLRVAKTTVAEGLFLKTLVGTKATEELTKGAWLAAVFGRGRVLGSWPVAGFGDEQVEEVCLFLLGACSCQVKNLNPGWDLLLSADWEAELDKADKLAAASGDAVANTAVPEKVIEPETVKIEGVAKESATPIAKTNGKGEMHLTGPNSINWTLIGGIAVLVAAGVFFWFGGQSRR